MEVQNEKIKLLKQLNLNEDFVADFAIVLGSGIKCNLPFIEAKVVKYDEIFDFHKTNVKGHSGTVTYGKLLNGKRVLIFAGRFHLYEGYLAEQVQAIVMLIDSLNIKNVFISNAAGGINPSLKVTDLMLITAIKDYQNDGNLDSERGLLDCVEKEELKINSDLTNELKEISSLNRGTYVAVLGPNYETGAEIELFKKQNCSAVGMSTYLEVKYCLEKQINVAAVSVITNSWFDKEIPSHEEVIQNSALAQEKFDGLLMVIL